MSAAGLAPRRLGLGFALGLGVATGAASGVLSGLERRDWLVAVAAAVCLTGFALLRRTSRMVMAMIAAIAVGFSLNMQITFLPITGVDLRRVGGGGGITISVCMISALVLIGLFGVQARGRTRAGWLRFDRTLTLAPVLFILAGIASIMNAANPAWSLYELYRLTMLLMIFVAVMNIEGAQLRPFTWVFSASIIFQGAVAILQTAFDANLGLSLFGENQIVSENIDFQETARATGTIGHPNILAYFFEITLPLMLALGIVARGWSKLLYLAAFGLGLCGMLATLSRGAWLTLPVTLPVVFLSLQGLRIRTSRGVLLLLGALAVGVVGLYYVYPFIETRLFADDGGSADRRVPLDLAALSIIEQFPVFGVGLNNFAETFTRLDHTGFARWPTPINHVVHNLYLLVWTEVGTVGFAAFLWYFGSALLVAFKVARHAPPWPRAIAIGAAMGLVGHLIHGVFDPGFKLSLPISQLIAAQIGLIAAVRLTEADAALAA